MQTQPFDPIAFLDMLDGQPGDFLDDLREFLDHLDDWAGHAQQAELEKADGTAEDVSHDFLYAVLDQRHLTDRPKRKWYNHRTRLGDTSGSSRRTLKRGITFHHTAVKGGFGADKALVRRYLKEAEENGVDMSRFVKSNRVLSPEEWARALALCHRFRGDPARKYNMGVAYHALSCANSVLVLNLPFEWCTWHGNGSNTHFLGYGWDARSSAESCAPIAHDLIQDVAHVVELARDEGHPMTEFTAHCAWTNKALDPGAEFIELVMMPAAKQLGCSMDLDFKSSYRGSKSLREVLEAT